jgi:hypothetical protein
MTTAQLGLGQEPLLAVVHLGLGETIQMPDHKAGSMGQPHP